MSTLTTSGVVKRQRSTTSVGVQRVTRSMSQLATQQEQQEQQQAETSSTTSLSDSNVAMTDATTIADSTKRARRSTSSTMSSVQAHAPSATASSSSSSSHHHHDHAHDLIDDDDDDGWNDDANDVNVVVNHASSNGDAGDDNGDDDDGFAADDDAFADADDDAFLAPPAGSRATSDGWGSEDVDEDAPTDDEHNTHDDDNDDDDNDDDDDDATSTTTHRRSANKGNKGNKTSVSGDLAPVGMQRTTSTSYRLLDANGLMQYRRSLIVNMMELLCLTEDECSVLLRHYRWKTKDVERDWYQDSDAVRKRLQLHDPESAQLVTSGLVQCQTAYCDEVDVSEARALACGHYFCKVCWQAFLVSQLNDGPTCIYAKCMGSLCTAEHRHVASCMCQSLVPESLIFELLAEADREASSAPSTSSTSSSQPQRSHTATYTMFLLNQFVDGNANVRPCPKPNCQYYVLRSEGSTLKSVSCRCSERFCFACGYADHAPAPCDLARLWREREQSSDATQIWLAARTKTCPSCKTPIEKNLACNHMRCTRCNHEFCWICKTTWSKHQGYACAAFDQNSKTLRDETDASKELNTIEESNRALQKYTYYYERFRDADRSRTAMDKLATKWNASIPNADWPKYTFLFDTVADVRYARQLLQWTYCLAYYMREGAEKRLFEHQQNMCLEGLESLQEKLDTKKLAQLLDDRSTIRASSMSLKKLCVQILQCVENGGFESQLMLRADSSASDKWGCSHCSTINVKDAMRCKKCSACRRHNEPGCHICR